MGEYVVKASQTDDLYLIWSTVTDSAHYVGTRVEIREHLWAEYRSDHPHCRPERGWSPDDRMERADSFGSSALAPPGSYGWEDEAFVVREDVPPGDGLWMIPRTNLVAYTRALIAEDETAAHALLQAIEEEAGGIDRD